MFASISAVHSTGLVLVGACATNAGQQFWLPSQEWSNDHTDWQAALRGVSPGVDHLDVVTIPGYTGEGGLPAVSRRRFSANDIDDSWLWHTRIMTVAELTKTLIRGTIGGIDAVMSREAYERFLDDNTESSLLLDHGALGVGDAIGGLVVALRTSHATVELDPVQFLDQLNHSLQRAPDEPVTTRAYDSVARESDFVSTDIGADAVTSIESVLLLENDPTLRAALARRLAAWGLSVTAIGSFDTATRWLDETGAVHLPSQRRDARRLCLAIIDPNLNIDNNDLRGMDLVSALCLRPDWRILILTGEARDSSKLSLYGDVRVHGFEHKPLSVRGLGEAIDACVGLDRPLPLREWIGGAGEEEDGQQCIPELPLERGADVSHVPLERRLAGVLHDLERLRPGATIHIFGIHGRSFRAQSLAHSGQELNWRPFRGKIRKSRIYDTAVGTHAINEAVPFGMGHMWTQKMLEYGSFCGVPIAGPLGLVRHCLVAFHPEGDLFGAGWVSEARLCAERARRMLEVDALLRSREQEATFAASGLVFECLAHELTNDLMDLSLDVAEVLSLLSPSPSTGQLETHADAVRELVLHQEDVSNAMVKLGLLRGVRATATKVCLQSAIRQAGMGCRRAAAELMGPSALEGISIEVLEEPWGDLLYVTAVPAAIVVVVFNLYLNSVQQMLLMSDIRTSGRVWCTLRTVHDSRGNAWAIVQVHDTGPGIHKDDWERVFAAGYSTKPGGTGLGLHICRHLLRNIRRRGCRAELDITRSLIWAGTTATVRLPLVLGEDSSND